MTIQYQGVWTLPVAARLQSTQQWATDPLYRNTTLLLQADDAANAAQNNTFIDSSSNNFTITRNGNTTQGTFTPYSLQPGAWSNAFNGSNSYLSLADTVDWDLGATWTIEAWLFPLANSASKGLSTRQNQNTGDMYDFFIFSNNTWGFEGYNGNNTSGPRLTSSTYPANQWHHVAFVTTGNNTFTYVNGILANTYANSLSWNSSYGLTIGASIAYSEYFNGYISNLRIVKGTALYTTNFTPSTTPLTAVTNTKLLTCQSNAFIDTNTQVAAKTITVNGSPSVQAFSPFAPQYQWTAPVIGGSGYFDGSGDQLTAPNNTAFVFGSGSFTVEMWVYATGTVGSLINYSNGVSTNSNWAWDLYQTSATGIQISLFEGTTQYIASSTSFSRNAWNHIAAVRDGNTMTIYVNGVAGGTTVNVTGVTANDPGGSIVRVSGYSNSSSMITGYLSNIRVIKGTAVYTGAFTPPTRPLATSGAASAASYPSTTNVNTTFASSATSLLLNFTNAGIYDGTMKNNLETVGNAQVSTSVVKYGTGSMYFDGSGDYLTLSPSQSLTFGTGDFTVEMWVYPTSYAAATNYPLWDQRGTSVTTTGYYFGLTQTNGFPMVYVYPSIILTGTSGPALNTWSHVAFSRSAGIIRAFVNGVQVGSVSSLLSVTDPGGYSTRISQSTVGATENYTGYIDDLRITKGVARYTANFTPPTVALPRQ